jgi:SAM-dependent methyltransferase
MLPSSIEEYWPEISNSFPEPLPKELQPLLDKHVSARSSYAYDTGTRANFSNEWDNHDIGGRTWTMELSDRVNGFFLEPLKIPQEELAGRLMLDAGCGNGSQSVAYTNYGLEVVAADLSTGLEKGYAFRHRHPGAEPSNIHFVQADLANPPFADSIFDIIHSAGVLHHTPSTEHTFRALAPLLKPGGTFFVWLYKYEKVVTPIVNTMRAVTTRIPPALFAGIAHATSIPFIGFCWLVNKLGIRSYETPNRREATIAVHDIFGAPYAHYHDFDQVSGWYQAVGIDDVWRCCDSRRGFGVCGRSAMGQAKSDRSVKTLQREQASV